MMVKHIGKLEHILADLIQVNKTMEERLDKHGTHLYTLEQLDIPQQVSISVSEVVTDAVDWPMQAPLRNHFRDLPEVDMKEILHQRMWESNSYKSHEDHMQLFEALEKSMNRDHSEELAHNLAKAQKKRKKSRESAKTPPGSPSYRPPPPPPPAGPSRTSGAPRAFGSQVTPPPPTSTNQDSPSKGSAAPSPSKTAATTEHQAWTTPDVTPKPLISLTPADLDMDEAMGLDEQAQLSNEEDIGSAHIPITGDIATFMDWFCKRRGITELKPQDLEGPAYEIVKVFHPNQTTTTGGPPGQVTIQSDFFFNKDLEYLRYGSKGRRPALSILKMKAAYYPDAGLEQMVLDQFWIEEEFKYDIAALYGHLNHLSLKDKKILTTAVNQWTRQLVIRQRVEDFQLGIESNQTQVNLTKPQWMATSFEYKHDYTVIESPRAVIFRDKYEVQMMMCFNEIRKFSDGTLQQMVEALDYWVKEFRINRINQSASASGHSKSKHTIESKDKRSSKIISLGHDTTLLASSHTVKSKTDIKSPTHYPCVGFNSLVHSLHAMSALRRSGLRTASTAAKPCQGDSSEVYLITGSIHTDQRGTVVLATLFNGSEQRHFHSVITNINLQEHRRLQLLAKRMSIHNSMLTL
uniref:Uncharacterized protein n=1 Tax=Tanacetum cinerariifolium TaxID=118510 RepID=A0A699HR32_TANCI|nr:hypothetical protein [Tanacetum cinerariifolium]